MNEKCELQIVTSAELYVEMFNLSFSYVLQRKKKKDTVCIALADETYDEPKIKMNKVIRTNLRVRLGDMLYLFTNVQMCTGHFCKYKI